MTKTDLAVSGSCPAHQTCFPQYARLGLLLRQDHHQDPYSVCTSSVVLKRMAFMRVYAAWP